MYMDNMRSPNFDSRDGTPVDMLLLHYTGMRTAAAAIDRLCDAEAKVSAHYVVDEDGAVLQLVDEDMRAWHAGVASWRGEANINHRSIGIEIVNPGHEFGYRAFPDVQIDAVVALASGILSRYPIPARNVVGHSDVAPTRKEDPGELFPWARLAGDGVGLFPNDTGVAPTAEHDVKDALDYVGYDTKELQAAVIAFQRHYCPNRLDGVADFETRAMLAALRNML